VAATDVSLARLHKMGVHIRRKKLHLPKDFIKNANNALVRGDLPRLTEHDVIHSQVASTAALRMVAVMRQLQAGAYTRPLFG
jgi:hypothetical protein